jgi:ATP-dependent DNA helicase DinG
MKERIREVFDDGGILSEEIDEYTQRPQQTEMSEAVTDTLIDGGTLLVEAPTGVGKTFAYGVPALLLKQEVGKVVRTLIVTAKISLQEQIIDKDLPFLRDILSERGMSNSSIGLAKGFSNYVCLDKIYKGRDKGFKDAVMAAVSDWVDTTETGDRSELPVFVDKKIWNTQCATPSNRCPGRGCPHFIECFAVKARKRLSGYDILVCNYHIFLSDLLVREVTNNSSQLLPKYDYIIMDEGHQLPDIARDFFGVRVSKHRFRRLASDMDKAKAFLDRVSTKFVDALQKRLFNEARKFEKALATYYKAHKDEAILSPNSIPRWQDICSFLAAGADRLERIAGYADEQMEFDKGRPSLVIGFLAKRFHKLQGDLAKCMLCEDKTQAFYAEKTAAGHALCSKLISPAAKLKAMVFDKKAGTVVTSATLTVGGSFKFIADELGVEDFTGLVVGTPFDYDRVLTVIPGEAPHPRDACAKTTVGVLLGEVVKILGGGVLGLFTSIVGRDTAAEVLGNSLKWYKLDKRVLCQGRDGSRSMLVREFRDDTDSILLGTDSFWEGLDVQGQSLRCVVIDKIPFPRMNDPVFAALEKQGVNIFMEQMIPRATIRLKQGFGRLIRTQADYGVVVLLDKRLVRMPYGRKLLSALPVKYVADELKDIEEFMSLFGG